MEKERGKWEWGSGKGKREGEGRGRWWDCCHAFSKISMGVKEVQRNASIQRQWQHRKEEDQFCVPWWSECELILWQGGLGKPNPGAQRPDMPKAGIPSSSGRIQTMCLRAGAFFCIGIRWHGYSNCKMGYRCAPPPQTQKEMVSWKNG